MNFAFLVSKNHWFFKLGRFQRGNPDVLLAPKFGYSHFMLANKPYTYYVWKGKITVLSMQDVYRYLYTHDEPDQRVVRSIVRTGTGELLKYQSGHLLVYKNNEIESRIPHWIDIRNNCYMDAALSKYTNVPVTNKRGDITDINHFLDLMEGLEEEMGAAYTMFNK